MWTIPLCRHSRSHRNTAYTNRRRIGNPFCNADAGDILANRQHLPKRLVVARHCGCFLCWHSRCCCSCGEWWWWSWSNHMIACVPTTSTNFTTNTYEYHSSPKIITLIFRKDAPHFSLFSMLSSSLTFICRNLILILCRNLFWCFPFGHSFNWEYAILHAHLLAGGWLIYNKAPMLLFSDHSFIFHFYTDPRDGRTVGEKVRYGANCVMKSIFDCNTTTECKVRRCVVVLCVPVIFQLLLLLLFLLFKYESTTCKPQFNDVFINRTKHEMFVYDRNRTSVLLRAEIAAPTVVLAWISNCYWLEHSFARPQCNWTRILQPKYNVDDDDGEENSKRPGEQP